MLEGEEDIINHNDNNTTEMLLLFDLHKEKIQFIRLPTEATLTPTMDEHQYLVTDCHLLEYKGYLCIACFEKIMNVNSDGHQNSCSKLHLNILKDKVKQVWIKGETFDVQIKDEQGLPPGRFVCYSMIAAAAHPRLLTLYDQVILYWFDGEWLAFYNLQTKHLEVVYGTYSYRRHFQIKNKPAAARDVRCDDSTFCPYMEYQLHAVVENMLSMTTFIPEGEVSKTNSFPEFKQLLKDKSPVGWVATGKQSLNFYAFF